MKFSDKNLGTAAPRSHEKSGERRLCCPPALLCASCLVLAFSAAPAQAFDTRIGTIDLGEGASGAFSSTSPSSAVADSCLPLLKSIHHNSYSATDRNRRPAGKAASLSFVFGVRFALTPPEVAKARKYQPSVQLDFWSPSSSGSGVLADDRSALAVSDYRQCQKRQALKALGGIHWPR